MLRSYKRGQLLCQPLAPRRHSHCAGTLLPGRVECLGLGCCHKPSIALTVITGSHYRFGPFLHPPSLIQRTESSLLASLPEENKVHFSGI